MKKAVASEMILTIGILIATFILLLQIRNFFNIQQKIAQGELLYQFKDDIKNLIDKSTAVSGDTFINYKPLLKKYIIDVNNNKVTIYDKISQKSVSFFLNNVELKNNRIEDKTDICIKKFSSKSISQIQKKDFRFGLTGLRPELASYFMPLNPTITRHSLGWDIFEPTNNNYDWSQYDDKLNGINKLGIQDIGLFSATAIWASENPSPSPFNGIRDGMCGAGPKQLDCKIDRSKVNEFREAVKSAIERYQYINNWEFWNEPEEYTYMRDPEEYEFWLKEFYNTVKSVDKNKKVAAGSEYGWEFIKHIDHSFYDAVVIHPYQKDINNPDPILKDKIIELFNNAKKPVWITEYGWDFKVFGEDQQAIRLQSALEWIIKQDFIEIAVLFRLSDSGDVTYGIMDQNFNPRKAYSIFQNFPRPVELRSGPENIIIELTGDECSKM